MKIKILWGNDGNIAGAKAGLDIKINKGREKDAKMHLKALQYLMEQLGKSNNTYSQLIQAGTVLGYANCLTNEGLIALDSVKTIEDYVTNMIDLPFPHKSRHVVLQDEQEQ